MFMSQYNHTIDAKGRIIVPVKFRETLGEDFVITKGFDGCLYAYTNEAFEAFTSELRKLSLLNKNARQISRFFISGAVSCEIDKQGRILIPANLREFASLDKDVVLAGVLDKVEIWAKEKWDLVSAESDDDIEDLAEGLSELGIQI